MFVTSRLVRNVMERVVDQPGMRQCGHRSFRCLRIIEQLHQRLDVVTAEHGAKQLCGMLSIDHRALGRALRDIGKKCGLDIRSLVHAGWNTVRKQVNQEFFFARGRLLDQFRQIGDL